MDKNKQWAKIVAKAWADPTYKAQLIKNPVAVLKAEGLPMPDGAGIRVVEETPNEEILVIPRRPDSSAKVENIEDRIVASYWT